MNQILYEKRCKCITKKRKIKTISEGKSFQYPQLDEVISKTFQIKYEKNLSSAAKSILNNFQNKYIYYAIDDILYVSQLNSLERENLLEILYTPVLSLQNNFCINFFDIWIREVYITEIAKVNKFININSQTYEQFSYITIKFFYTTRSPVKKQEPLW